MVERAAHNGLVVGSNPARPILISILIKVKITPKNYHVKKLKILFKEFPLIFIYQTQNIKNKDWVFLGQKLKQSKINQYQVPKSAIIKMFRSSIYKNFDVSMCSNIVIISLNKDVKSAQLEPLIEKLNTSSVCVAVKLNNQIYTALMIRNIKLISYKQAMLSFVSVLTKYLKTPYIWKSK